MGNRKAAEEFIITYINKIIPDKSNEILYRNLFKSMNDKEFDQFMESLNKKEKRLCVVAPTFTGNKLLNVERNLKIA